MRDNARTGVEFLIAASQINRYTHTHTHTHMVSNNFRRARARSSWLPPPPPRCRSRQLSAGQFLVFLLRSPLPRGVNAVRDFFFPRLRTGIILPRDRLILSTSRLEDEWFFFFFFFVFLITDEELRRCNWHRVINYRGEFVSEWCRVLFIFCNVTFVSPPLLSFAGRSCGLNVNEIWRGVRHRSD